MQYWIIVHLLFSGGIRLGKTQIMPVFIRYPFVMQLLIARDSSHAAFTYSPTPFTNMHTNRYPCGARLGRPTPAAHLKAEARVDVPGALRWVFRKSLQMVFFIVYVCVCVFYIFRQIDIWIDRQIDR